MRLSARNQFKGKVVDVKKGVTTTHVRIDIGGGHVVTASITNESAEELGLAPRGFRPWAASGPCAWVGRAPKAGLS
jgi:molybdopterin-binding protein